MKTLQRAVRAAFVPLERAADRIFGSTHNPLSQLGALGFFFYWIVIATGVHLYIGFDTSIAGAYGSVEMLSRSAWFLGGVSRSLHRYASDALVLVMLLHMAREFGLDRYRGARWFSWIVGMPILMFVYASGITGYWLVWDRLAQYIAIATTEFLDWLPVFGEPIARNFLAPGSVDDRFFSLLIFMHIAVPLILVFVLWVHLQRISCPRINPPRAMAAGAGLMLLGLSLVFPAVSQEPADLGRVTAVLGLDWFYLAFYPLIDHFSPGPLWGFSTVAFLLVALLPWLPKLRPPPAAVVSLDHCNGCARCADDCPFNAITMSPRTDGRPFAQQAVVDPALCVACGICVAACPPSTPFRTTPALRTGIDLPTPSLADLRQITLAAAARGTGAPRRILLFGCAHGAVAQRAETPGCATVILPCIGMLPPSFIDYVLSRDLADGVMLTGCDMENCHHRFGVRWTEQRLAGQRDPHLRTRVPRERLATCWAGVSEPARLEEALAAFNARIAAPREKVT
jgi:quinol-cytochrome oxidoreductase complex cytochrome b subunit/ferredoxin/coenzyme F420-reducing hydrogenase delta subunit